MIKVQYFVDGNKFAERFKEHIPRKGELLRFNKKLYIVVTIVHVEDEPDDKDPFVSIDMVRETY